MFGLRVLSLVCLAFAIGCGSTTSPKAPPPEPSAAPEAATPVADRPASPEVLDAEGAARRFFEAMVRGDEEGMKRVTLTHAELAELSKKAPSKDDYEKEVDGFVQDRAREFKEAPAGTKLVTV